MHKLGTVLGEGSQKGKKRVEEGHRWLPERVLSWGAAENKKVSVPAAIISTRSWADVFLDLHRH
jgi:hypothetical protein